MYRYLLPVLSFCLLSTGLAFHTSAADLPPIPGGSPETPRGPGGGTRDPLCPEESNSSMQALAPSAYNRGGLTQAEQPILWLYLPFNTTPEHAIQLTLKRISGDFNRTFVAPNLQRGFVGIPLSSTEVFLPVDEPLEWTFKLYCGGIDDVGDRSPYFVRAWIARIDSSTLAQPIPETTSVQILSEAYRDNALWYDALVVLGESMLGTSPAINTRSLWRQLLVDGGFEAIANEPHIQYLTIPEK